MDEENQQPGFRPIGSLVPKISRSPSGLDWTATPSQRISAITGSPPAGPKPASTIGTRHGAGGAVANMTELSQLLQTDTPDLTDKALLRLLPPRLVSSLVSKNRERVDEVYGYEIEFVGYDFSEPLDPDEREQALKLVEYALEPADARVILAELARLRALTKARAEDANDLEMLAHVYAEELSRYPGDVVRAALRSWTRREKWWPAWAELKAELDRMTRKREALCGALKRTR